MKDHNITDVDLLLVHFLPQMRHSFDDAARVCVEASDRAIEDRQPVRQRPTKNGRFVVLDGKRRFRAEKAMSRGGRPRAYQAERN